MSRVEVDKQVSDLFQLILIEIEKFRLQTNSEVVNPRLFAINRKVRIMKEDFSSYDRESLQGYYAILESGQKIIVYKENLGAAMIRKVIAHELSHILLDSIQEQIQTPGRVIDLFDLDLDGAYNENEQIRELACEKAAREMLMPETIFVFEYKRLSGTITNREQVLQALASVFTVPLIDVETRLREIGTPDK